MELQTISQVSKQFKISTRTLRYYEQIGLIQSTMKEDYSYRAYDEDAILRLKQIIVLRKLRIPLKSIAEILLTENTALLIEVFQQNLSEIEDEVTALTTIKSVIQSFIERLNIKNTRLQLLDDESLLEIVDFLTTSKINFKEDKTMDDLIKAEKKLTKLTDKDVRIVYLPPMTIAAAIGEGEGSEGKVGDMIKKFVIENELLKIKPDARSFGFDCGKGNSESGSSNVYEMWVSVPDDMDIPSPLIKRKFKGGLYAAHVLRAWDFQDWQHLRDWVNASTQYENDWGSDRWVSPETVAGQGFEEVLNFYNFIQKGGNLQLDLLFPIKEKN